MDPVTLLGTAGAVANIVDVITTTIKTLKGLHDRWKDADLTIVNLISQLTSLRAALNKITEWTSLDLADNPQHHQLIMDLEQSVTCCQMLMQSMQSQLAKLNWSSESSLDLGSRIRVVFEDKTSKDFQKFVKRQTSALTLLLSACSCKTISEQKALLERPLTRKAFDQIKDDSSSLIVLYDTASVLTVQSRSTGTSSKISRVFPFDSELIVSQVYQRAVRSLFRKPNRRAVDYALKQDQEDPGFHGISLTSEDIVKKLMVDEPTRMERGKLLLLGEQGEAKDSLMKILHDRALHNEKNASVLKLEVILASLDHFRKLLDKIDHDGWIRRQLAGSLETSRTGSYAREALRFASQEAWDRLNVGKMTGLFQYMKTDIDPEPFSFLQNFNRILNEDFVPTEQDLLKLSETAGPRRFCIQMGTYPCTIIPVIPEEYSVMRLAPRFRDITAIICVAQTSSNSERWPLNYDLASKMETERSLKEFEAIASLFPERQIILLLYDSDDRFASESPPWLYSPKSNRSISKVGPAAMDLADSCDDIMQSHRKDADIHYYIISPDAHGVFECLVRTVDKILLGQKILDAVLKYEDKTY